MGGVTVAATIENLGDVLLAQEGKLSSDSIRQVAVPDALIDTGAATLSMPKNLIDQLGLKFFTTRPMRTTTGVQNFKFYAAARVTIQDRYCSADIAELPPGSPVLIGQVPLEMMDFIVDPKGQRIIGNPAHGGKWMLDMF